MTRPWAAPSAHPTVWQRAALVVFAAALLLTGFAGHAGVQVVDGAMAARLFALHPHNVPGEAAYVQAFGVPAPFVHPHCHDAVNQQVPQPSPDEVNAAAALAGSLDCAAADLTLTVPSAAVVLASDVAAVPNGRTLLPLLPPPQA